MPRRSLSRKYQVHANNVGIMSSVSAELERPRGSPEKSNAAAPRLLTRRSRSINQDLGGLSRARLGEIFLDQFVVQTSRELE